MPRWWRSHCRTAPSSDHQSVRVRVGGRMFHFMRSGKLFGFVAAFALLAASTDALAQSTVNATIRGKVTDETGGALPGVTVVATSPALIQGQRSSVTDADGNYAVLDLP